MTQTVTIQQVYCYKINTFTKKTNNDMTANCMLQYTTAEQHHTAEAAAAEFTNYNEEWRMHARTKHQNTSRRDNARLPTP